MRSIDEVFFVEIRSSPIIILITRSKYKEEKNEMNGPHADSFKIMIERKTLFSSLHYIL